MKSEIARPYITKEIEMRDRIGPYQYSLYQKQKERHDFNSGKVKDEINQQKGIFQARSPGDRNKNIKYENLAKKN